MQECNTNDCPYVHRIDALEKMNERHAETHNQIYERLRKVETDSSVQTVQYENIIEKLDSLTESHTNLKKELAEIREKPAKRWESIVDKVIWGVIGAVLAYLLARIGL